jgi:hypothetical protein
MALKAPIGGAFKGETSLNMAQGSTFNWSEINVPDTLNTLRVLAKDNSLSEENRQAIDRICRLTEHMQPQIQEQATQQRPKAMAAGTGG